MMKRLELIALLAVGTALLTGCSERHLLTIDPTIPVSLSHIGNRKAVSLKVVDARKSNSISQWQGQFHFRKFSVHPDANMAEALKPKIAEGLKRMGFAVKRQHQKGATSLRVDILQLTSRYNEKLPRLDVKVNAALGAVCESGQFRNT
jgi:uncharacterized lipoprotein YajG